MLNIYYPELYPLFHKGMESLKKTILSFDPNGIPLVEYKGQGKHYQPTTISFYLLMNHADFILTKKDEFLQNVIKCADWLVKNKVERNCYVTWIFNFQFSRPGYVCMPPWHSALTIGVAISALLRAYELTKNNQYLKTAKDALNAFEVKVADGGVTTIDKNGNLWYEEYPPPKGVSKWGTPLNGFIFTLLGMYDYYTATGDKKAKVLFEMGINTLEKHIHEYDLHILFFRWSRYDNYCLTLANEQYHRIHIAQMKILYRVTGIKVFEQYRKKWEKAEKNCRWIYQFLNKAVVATDNCIEFIRNVVR